MVEGGPIDVLTGDWLAELTMLILSRIRAKRPASGVGKAGTDTRVSPWTATVVISLGVPGNQGVQQMSTPEKRAG